jgi:hypothetical protein
VAAGMAHTAGAIIRVLECHADAFRSA